MQKAKKKVEQDCENLNRKIQDLELALKKAETEKQSKDNQIRSLQDEMTHQDDLVAKLNKEKKQQEEVNKKLLEDLQAAEDEVNHLNKIRTKLEQQLDDVSPPRVQVFLRRSLNLALLDGKRLGKGEARSPRR